MKKKIKSKSNSKPISRREKVLFVLITLFWLLLAIYNIYIFYNEYTVSFQKDEPPIGTITFKYKTASRRFQERTIWDRLQQSSPVYNGDTIRTENMSEATIRFINDRGELNLVDNSMTQIFLSEETGLTADLLYGTLLAEAGDDGGDFVISHKGKSVTVGKNSSASIAVEKNNDSSFKVQGIKGTSYVRSGDDETLVSEGQVQTLTGNDFTKALVTVIEPTANKKIISGNNEENVRFRLNLENIDTYKAKIEVSQKKDFSSIYDSESAENKVDFTRPLKPGINYWRLSVEHSGGVEEIEGRVFVIHSLPPVLVAPAKDYSFSFRKKFPALRFIWSESENASSYRFEIASNRNMQNPVFSQNTDGTSSIVSAVGKIGFYGPSDVGEFLIEKKGEFADPSLVLPRAKDFVDTTEGVKNTIFSWESKNEAKSYIIQISNNPNMTKPLVKAKVENNYFSVDAKKLGITDGTCYWNVSAVDAEGNISDRGETREFIALKGQIIHRSIYPPDGYKIAENLLSNTSFTWKSNLPFDSYFQVADESSFAKLNFEGQSTSEKISGLALGPGRYYWRVKTVDSNLNLDFTTDSKTFYVIKQLDAPSCDAPNVSNRAVVRPGQLTSFNWSKIFAADYYKVIVTNPKTGEEIFEQNLIQDNTIDVDLRSLPEGQYAWSVQAFAFETENSTRLSGLLGETSFALRQVYPVELHYPENLAKIDGREALISPKSATWSTKDVVGKSELVIKNMKTGETVRITSPKKEQVMPKLRAGVYSWTVKASADDDIDLTPDRENYFTVLPIPPIPSTSIKEPAPNATLDDDYFLSRENILFEWAPVAEATHYFFVLKNPKGKTIVNKKFGKDTSFDFTELNRLSVGTFTWTVEAVNCIADGTVLQESDVQTGTFDVRISEVSGETEKTGTLYGVEKKKKKR